MRFLFLLFPNYLCATENKQTANNLIDSVDLQAISIKIYDYSSENIVKNIMWDTG